MMRPLRRSISVREWTMLGLLLAVGFWIHRAAWLDMLSIGLQQEEQSHILLAPFVAGWLLWLRRSRFMTLRVGPSLWGPLGVIVGQCMAWYGAETDMQVVWHCASIVTLLGCVVSMYGPGLLRAGLPAIVALLFLIPVPGFMRQIIAIPLQAIAAGTTQVLLELLGIPATRLGHVLLINGEQVAVGEACNGMRMVFALWLIVYAFAFSVPLRQPVRGLLLVLSPLTALITNVVRLIPTTLLYGYGTVAQAHTFHDISGWIMLPVALFMLVGVLRAIRWVEFPVMKYRLAVR